MGDRPQWDANLGNFTKFNEPYYTNYINCDLGAMFQEAGFQCDTKYVSSASKTLSFMKPLQAGGDAAEAPAPAPVAADSASVAAAAAAATDGSQN